MIYGPVPPGKSMAKKKPSAESETTSPMPDASGNIRLEVMVKPEFLAELDAWAEAQGMNRSAFVRWACKSKIQELERQSKS